LYVGAPVNELQPVNVCLAAWIHTCSRLRITKVAKK